MAASNSPNPLALAGRADTSRCRPIIAARPLFAALALCLGLPLWTACWAAPSVDPYVGQWEFQAGGRNLLVLRFAAGSVAQPLVGWLMRPKSFSLNGQTVSQVRLPIIREDVVRAQLTDAGVRFTVRDTSDPTNTDDFEFKLKGADAGALSFAVAPLAPLAMARVTADAQVATDWMPEATYGPDNVGVSNPEMSRLFAADQADRHDVGHIDWSKVAKADSERRRAVAALLDAGALHTGTDFLGAAFVFQHGDRADDFLLAHVLAMVAVSKGRTDANWIAAASLDRYLQRTGRPQIFGTQFSRKGGNSHPTQEPFDRRLISDALRTDLNVPALASQASPSGQ
jgi:hypothetical protein